MWFPRFMKKVVTMFRTIIRGLMSDWPTVLIVLSTTVLVVVFLIAVVTVLGFLILLVDDHLDFWVSYLKHIPTDVPSWVSAVLVGLWSEHVLFLLIVSIVVRAGM